MRQPFVFREDWPNRLVGPRGLGFIVYQIVVLLLASGLVWAREDPKHEANPAVPAASEILPVPRGAAEGAPDSAPTLTPSATPSSSVRFTASPASEPANVRPDPGRSLSTTSASKEFAFHQGWRFWADVAVAAGIGVGVYALAAGGSSQALNSHAGAKTAL